jgi:hypothetical protein
MDIYCSRSVPLPDPWQTCELSPQVVYYGRRTVCCPAVPPTVVLAVMANATLADSLIPDVASAGGALPSIDILWPSKTFVLAVFLLCITFHLLAPLYTTTKQLSWILTTVVSATMTLVSIPFVWDYVASGGDVKSIRTLSPLTYTTSRIFQAYLVSDLMMGAIYYRSQVGLLTGWIHHIVYMFIVQIAIKRAWTQIFCLCALMELPTFLLAISSLYPRLRSNVAFAVSFFVTRILLHTIWCISYLIPTNRAHTTGGSILPSIMLASVFPLHALWFRGCVKGFVKRYKDDHASVPEVVTVDAVSPTREDKQSSSSSASYISFRRAAQSHPARQDHPLRSPRRTNYRTWPARETIYDFVGLSHPTPHTSRRSLSAVYG